MITSRGAFYLDPDGSNSQVEAVMITRNPVSSSVIYSGTIKPVCVLAGSIPMIGKMNYFSGNGYNFNDDGSLSEGAKKAIGSLKCSGATKPMRSCTASQIYTVIYDYSEKLIPWNSKLPDGTLDYSADRMSGAAFNGGSVVGVSVIKY